MIWLLGSIFFLVYRLFNAGRNRDSLFYRDSTAWDGSYRNKVIVRTIDEDEVLEYVFISIGVALTWPLALPAIGIYLLGKKLAK